MSRKFSSADPVVPYLVVRSCGYYNFTSSELAY